MDVKDAARIFHDWAFAEGFLSDPATTPSTPPASMSAIDPVTEAGKQVLRIKQVQFIGLDEPSHEIIVFTKRAAPTKKQRSALPDRVDDVSIRYRQGLQHAIGEAPAVPFGAPFTIRQVAQSRHYACGSSISVGNSAEAGTLGAIVRDASGDLYGLSNNHVSGSCSFANVGMPILAPGVLDVAANSLPPFTLGFHHRALPLLTGSPSNVAHVANLDAAIFKIANPTSVSSFQGDAYDTPASTAPLAPQMDVEKVGRTTGHTFGKVLSQIYGAAYITYRCVPYNFSGPVYFEPLFVVVGVNAPFSEGGDSGSLVTTVDQQGNRRAVGLVVGGGSDNSAPGGKTSLVLPLEPILQALNVTLVAGHNV